MGEKEAKERPARDWELSPEQAAAYHQARGREHSDFTPVDEQTWSDLELEKVLARLDRCVTPPGAQYLLALLKNYPKEPAAATETAKEILALKEHPEAATALRKSLKPLNRKESTELTDFVFGAPPTLPAHHKFFYVMSAVTIACMLGLILSRVFLLPLIALFIINGLLHWWFGERVICHSPALTSLATLFSCLPKITEAIREAGLPESKELADVAPTARMLQKRISRAFLRRYGNDELFLVLLDYLNIFCLFELSALCHAIKTTNEERPVITKIFELTARLDAIQGLAAVFAEYPSLCIPEVKPGRNFALVDAYHPLLEKPVNNSVEGAGNSILLTGTNMAGKTTFIKTLAINLIFSQTFGLCLARKATLPPARVRTLIERADVTTSRHSYFYFEAVELLRMLEDARKSGREHWFVLDEIFRGTNALERVAAGCAVLRHLDQQGLVVASTHDHELTTLLSGNFDQYHFSEAIVGNEARFDYLLRKGPCQTRNAIKLLGIAGYPPEVTEMAGRLCETNNVEETASQTTIASQNFRRDAENNPQDAGAA